MIYREAGQYKTSYLRDSQIFPIAQDRYAVAAMLGARGWQFARRSELAEGQRCDAQVILGDSMGEMPAWYAAADVTIMGGSLLPFGAQNLIEANAVGCPVVLGPSTFNFAQAAEASIKAGAAVQVADAGAAVEAALAIALDPGRRAAMAAAATAFTRSHRGATDRTLDAIEPFLPPVPGAAG